VRASATEASRLALSPFGSAPVDVHPESSIADFTTIRSSAEECIVAAGHAPGVSRWWIRERNCAVSAVVEFDSALRVAYLHGL
jgi:hypothetical protein